MTLRLRPYAPGDHEALLDLWQESWQVTLPTIDFAARRAWFSGYLSELVAGGVHLGVAEVEGRPAGFVTLDPASGYLDQIAVRRDLWGRGIAEALIGHAQGMAPGVVDLKVNQLNHRAIALYERLGFRRCGEGVSPASGLPLWHYQWRAAAQASG